MSKDVLMNELYMEIIEKGAVSIYKDKFFWIMGNNSAKETVLRFKRHFVEFCPTWGRKYTELYVSFTNTHFTFSCQPFEEIDEIYPIVAKGVK